MSDDIPQQTESKPLTNYDNELRDRIAIAAMQGMLSAVEHDVRYKDRNLSVAERVALDSYLMADKMMIARGVKQ